MSVPPSPAAAEPRAAEQAGAGLRGARVLVTGGTGFVGGRLVERLAGELGAEVRVLVRRFARAARVARFPVALRAGDVTDARAVAEAAEGCAVVFHCAYGTAGDPAEQRAVNVDGLRCVLDAAARDGARVVHVSTAAVYGTPRGEVLDEECPRPAGDDPYSSSKLAAEHLAEERARAGAPVVVLQPTCVYGPWSPSWTIRILADLKARRVPLVDGGSGLCNAVHVDDVVAALLAAAEAPGAPGERFLVSGPEPVTWARFYRAHERMLGFESTVALTLDEARARWEERVRRKSVLREALALLRAGSRARARLRASREVDLARRAARRVLPQGLRRALKARLRGPAGEAAPAGEKPLLLLPPAALAFHAARARVSTAKAERLLGYRPAWGFERGMRSVEAWARWAGLLDDER